MYFDKWCGARIIMLIRSCSLLKVILSGKRCFKYIWSCETTIRILPCQKKNNGRFPFCINNILPFSNRISMCCKWTNALNETWPWYLIFIQHQNPRSTQELWNTEDHWSRNIIPGFMLEFDWMNPVEILVAAILQEGI